MGLSETLGVTRSVVASYLVGSSRLVLPCHLHPRLPPPSDVNLLHSVCARHLEGTP